MSERVMLPPEVVARVIEHARRIEAVNKKRRRRNQMGYKPRGEESLINRALGYLAEAAFASLLGVQWSSIDDWKKVPDVGERWEVRSTTYRNGRLLITARDNPERDYVLVTTPRVMAMSEFEAGEHPLPFGPFVVVGWYNGERARQTQWWASYREQGGAWFVPQSVLHDIGVTRHG